MATNDPIKKVAAYAVPMFAAVIYDIDQKSKENLIRPRNELAARGANNSGAMAVEGVDALIGSRLHLLLVAATQPKALTEFSMTSPQCQSFFNTHISGAAMRRPVYNSGTRFSVGPAR